MVSPVQAAQKAAFKSVQRVAGEAVTFTRDSTTLDITRAVRASTNWNTENAAEGAVVSDKSIDWLIRLDDLTSGTTVYYPARGDTITDENGTVYRVMPFGPNDQLWSWHDRDGRSVVRVHTRERV